MFVSVCEGAPNVPRNAIVESVVRPWDYHQLGKSLDATSRHRCFLTHVVLAH